MARRSAITAAGWTGTQMELAQAPRPAMRLDARADATSASCANGTSFANGTSSNRRHVVHQQQRFIAHLGRCCCVPEGLATRGRLGRSFLWRFDGRGGNGAGTIPNGDLIPV
ncbi:hypothetical protein HETIRDRAFT_109038 [Heterobasidion irregulare TC 32-1]|uniref:Uncharacterized protein n=1 Tax=Heterobasidion irregulare (strain TC 32-1) TaxID=747525 RepID=W4JY26_HETIT|nr:uncharacterized protein HETIRDRAFT_109038 [Heterobasidion irregulare TC 32-1]ETW78443.1 hypothetical protein HETIRDRAFT_109038 [Heterobasidion irregulare TC 32-1]